VLQCVAVCCSVLGYVYGSKGLANLVRISVCKCVWVWVCVGEGVGVKKEKKSVCVRGEVEASQIKCLSLCVSGCGCVWVQVLVCVGGVGKSVRTCRIVEVSRI